MVGIVETILAGATCLPCRPNGLRRYGKSAGYQLLGGYRISEGITPFYKMQRSIPHPGEVWNSRASCHR